MEYTNAQQPGPVDHVEDAVCLMNMLMRAEWRTDEISKIQRAIKVHMQAARAGVARVPEDIQNSLRLLDPMLRARWDYVYEMWAIERWVEEDDFKRWALIAHRHNLDAKLFHDLRKGDTWKDGKDPKERLQEKREAAEQKQKSNDRAAQDKIDGAIDSLSEKQMRDFCAVEQAIATGDTIVAHGSDAAAIETMKRNAGPDIPTGKSVNRKLGKGRIKFKTGKGG